MKIEGTVLVADRNKGLLTALVLLLQKEFSGVITESEPDKIVQLCKDKSVDIIVLDTGGNGNFQQQAHLNLIREIAALDLSIQIVTLTNFGQSQYAMETIEAGAFDFIQKPWNNEKLVVTLRNAFRMRECTMALKQVGLQKDPSDIMESGGMDQKLAKPMTIEQMEAKMMRAALKRNKGNITLAAEQLGITRQTLYNKGKKHKLFK